MPFASVPSPTMPLTIPAVPLTPSAFSAFGAVIQNPRAPPAGSSTVNQGTASKYPQISPLTYIKALSGPPATANINLFVCKPRQLEHVHQHNARTEELLASSTGEVHAESRKVFRVKILERHPYTTQTFIPMGVDTGGNSERRYLVIVAPTLKEKSGIPPEARRRATTTTTKPTKKEKESDGGFWRPPPFPLRLRKPTKTFDSSNRPPPFPVPPAGMLAPLSKGAIAGRGLPDLSRLKAFVCTGSQAVTYGVGTWHAPMVALGDKEMDFVVVVHENGSGVGGQDTEECDIEGTGVTVEVPNVEEKGVRAKL